MAVSITISIDQNSQNVANNTSNVTVAVRASWTGGSYNHLQKSGWLKIDGTTYSFTSSFNTGNTSSGVQVLYSKTLNIAHNADGTKTLACSASYTSGVSSGTVGASASKALTTIPRKSTLSVANGTLGTAQTLKITENASSFTHKLYYTCGNSGTVYILGSSSSASTTLSTSWTPPLSLSSQNTTGTTVSIKFTLATYSGSTHIGSNSYTKTFSIPSSVKPSCAVTVTDATGISAKYGNMVRGLSKFKVSIAPTLSYGSAISTYRTTANGVTYTASSFTTGFLNSSGKLTVTAKVTDKRGRSGSDSETVTVLDYSIPTIVKLAVRRCDEDGTENDQGEFVQVSFSASVTSLNNLNSATYTLRYKRTFDSEFTEVVLSDYSGVYSVSDGAYIFPADSGSSYNVEFDATDNHNSTKRTTTASTGFTLMHWNAAGDGLAIGKISEIADVFDVGMQTRFYGGILHPVLEPETDLNDVRVPNTYVGANISNYNYANCPLTSGTFTLEVVGAGENGQVKQSIQTCSKAQSKTYERFYYSGSWGDWICVSDYDGALLWEGGYYMTAGHVITLSEAISKQRSGIILVFSEYVDGAAANQSFHTRFIPKLLISKHSGSAQCLQMTTSNLAYFATKYLYITDTQITGHDNNNKTGTSTCGITYTNGRFVLRYVIGV